VLARVLDGQRRAVLRDHSDQPLADRELDAPDGVGGQALGCAQRQALAVGLGQVDGADVGVEALGDAVDDVAQRLGQIVRAGDDAGDVGEKRAALFGGNRIAPFDLAQVRRSMYPTKGCPSPVERSGRRHAGRGAPGDQENGGGCGGRIASPDISDAGGNT
jgi:hypothetical protein